MITDRKIPKFNNVNSTFADYYDPVVLSASDYYPFGMEMPGRTMGMGGYRYGFNGKEKDTEGEWGTQTHYDYGFRIYEPAIGRWLSVDPRAEKYPSWSPFNYTKGNPIVNLDMDGDTVFIFSRLNGDGAPKYSKSQLLQITKAARITDKANGINSVYKVTTQNAIESGDLVLNNETDLVYAIGNGEIYTGFGITSNIRSKLGEGYYDGDLNVENIEKASKLQGGIGFVNSGIALAHESNVHGNAKLVSFILEKKLINGKHTNNEHGENQNLSDGFPYSAVVYPGRLSIPKLQSKDAWTFSQQKIDMANLIFEYQRLKSTQNDNNVDLGRLGHGKNTGTSATKKKLAPHYEAEKKRQ